MHLSCRNPLCYANVVCVRKNDMLFSKKQKEPTHQGSLDEYHSKLLKIPKMSKLFKIHDFDPLPGITLLNRPRRGPKISILGVSGTPEIFNHGGGYPHPSWGDCVLATRSEEGAAKSATLGHFWG